MLLDAARIPLYANAEALRMLGSRYQPADADSLAETLWPLIPDSDRHNGRGTVVLGGRRRYVYRVTQLTPLARGYQAAAYLITFDRPGPGPALEEQPVASQFALTQRESELLSHLMTGLTNKEIGEQMGISPNTVKAFLKLMMTKMGVSTRSAVVGRPLRVRARAGRRPP